MLSETQTNAMGATALSVIAFTFLMAVGDARFESQTLKAVPPDLQDSIGQTFRGVENGKTVCASFTGTGKTACEYAQEQIQKFRGGPAGEHVVRHAKAAFGAYGPDPLPK